MKAKLLATSIRITCLTMILVRFATPAFAVAERRFDIATFCCPCSPDQHFCDSQLQHLNWTSANGHFVAMGSDDHRSELNSNGNYLAVYYNTLNADYGSLSGAAAADDIQTNYIIANFTSNGVVPTWIILNEISAGSWPSDAAYRSWLIALVTRLHGKYGHSVVILSPFPNPGANASDWQSLANESSIAVENYLSGQEVNASGNSVSWCQTQYQSSVNSYGTLGVGLSKLYLAEHFGQTLLNTGWGRSGVSYAGWDNAINARSQAAHNIGFAGFVSYAWEFNQMLDSDTDLIHFEDTYASQTLP
jgi:hypothetical protein